MSLMLDWIIIRIICFISVVFLSIDVNLNDFCCVNQKEKKEKENMIKVYCKIWYLWEIVFTPSFFILFIYLFFLVIIGLNLELGVDHWLHDQLCNRQSNITHSVARRVLVPSLLFFQGLNIWPMDFPLSCHVLTMLDYWGCNRCNYTWIGKGFDSIS